MTATTRSASSVSEPTLYVAFELSQATWKLALTSGFAAPPVLQTVAPGDAAALRRVFAAARRRLGLPSATRVASCYEAGREGFWIHRWLTTLTVENRVVDSASIEVSRRAKRLAIGMMAACAVVMFLTAPKAWMAATGTAIMAVVAVWLWRRPEPRAEAPP